MNRNAQLAVFEAQVKNVRELDAAWKHVKRSINRDLVKGNQSSVRLHTKLLTLIYCAWLEASFSKLIHTPYGFDLSEIAQIKSASRNSIVEAWKECINIAALRVNPGKSNYLPNIKQRLNQLIEKYVEEPSLLRNKVAHGQWVKALNRENSAINTELTIAISNLDVVKLDILHDACKGLCEIVEVLIESPERAFHRDYWLLLSKLEEHMARTSQFNLADKIAILKSRQPKQVQVNSSDVAN
ncbi:hypothetical protein NDI52_28005 [Leptolyngbya sp. PL-A3]|uniref:hypothetical protein n=1 Tax=Leptolyngbya sp. PL-A3 TaxID=2933911 RepID=UPI003299C578